MKLTKTFAIFGILGAFLVASVGGAVAGDPFRVRCEVRSGKRAKIDVDVRDLTANSQHTVYITKVDASGTATNPLCTDSLTRNADLAGELDIRFDTNMNNENNLDGCFKTATFIKVVRDTTELESAFECTPK